jgi:hypothetical protein
MFFQTLYNPNQSGFRKNRNTMEQCIRLENDIQKSFVNKYITVGVFIDFYFVGVLN